MENQDASATIIPALEELQDGLSQSIQALLATYRQCDDPVVSATLLQQSQQLSAQMSQIETNLFHQEAVQATATVTGAFTSANGLINELTQMAADLKRVSDMIGTAAKLIGVVTQIIGYLPL